MSKQSIFITLVMGIAVSLSSTSPLEVRTTKDNISLVAKTAHTDSTWEGLHAHFELTHHHKQAKVQATTKHFLNENYQLTEVLERGTEYFHFISQELQKRDLPLELMFLPLIESEYNPNARSHKNAAGLWQLMPETGRLLGLEHDERYDVRASTKAALNHLAYLNKKFKGDWLITLAAYNAGEGNVSRFIENNRAAGKPTDFWSLNIPFAETRNYVLRFLALIEIIENSHKYDVKLPTIDNQHTLYASLEVKSSVANS